MFSVTWINHICNAFAVSENILLSAGRCILFIRKVDTNYKHSKALLVNVDGSKNQYGYPIIWSMTYFIHAKRTLEIAGDNDAGLFVASISITFIL